MKTFRRQVIIVPLPGAVTNESGPDACQCHLLHEIRTIFLIYLTEWLPFPVFPGFPISIETKRNEAVSRLVIKLQNGFPYAIDIKSKGRKRAIYHC